MVQSTHHLNSCFQASAQVRICYHIPTAQRHVVKIISKPYSSSDFELEINILKKIGSQECPYVVKFFDFFEDNRYFYSVMEYCSGGELLSVLGKGERTTEVMLAEWFRQILEGIAHIHFHGVVHRDVKPQNFVFSDETAKVIKIIDFGYYGMTLTTSVMALLFSLSFPMKKGELLNEPCGIAEYLSPEMILGSYGRKVDIWSLGIVCFLTLFGRRPFVALTAAELFRKIVECEPDYTVSDQNPMYNPSDEAVSFCKMLLRKNVRARPTAVGALQHVWLTRAKETLSKNENHNVIEIPQNIRQDACNECWCIEEREKQRLEEASRLSSKIHETDRCFTLRKVLSVCGNPKKREGISTDAQSTPNLSLSKLFKPKEQDIKCTRVNVMQYTSLLDDVKNLRQYDGLSDCVETT